MSVYKSWSFSVQWSVLNSITMTIGQRKGVLFPNINHLSTLNPTVQCEPVTLLSPTILFSWQLMFNEWGAYKHIQVSGFFLVSPPQDHAGSVTQPVPQNHDEKKCVDAYARHMLGDCVVFVLVFVSKTK